MDWSSTLIGGVFGLLVGAAAMLAYRYSERQQLLMPPSEQPELDDGVVRVLQVLRSAAVVVRHDGTVVRGTPAAYAFGIVRDGAIVHPAVQDMAQTVRREGIILDEEHELARGPVGRGTILLSLRVAPLGGEHILITAEDRTEARRLEAIRRDFVVNVSHELKTPVGAIALLAETMQDAADDPKAVSHFATRMQEEATRLAMLVHEIIELSRLQVSGAIDVANPISVDEVIAEAVDRALTRAQAKNIVIDAEEDSGAKVFGDHAMLVTAVRNLIDNAVNYSAPATRVGVGVEVSQGLVEIHVVDQGIGLSDEDQQRIFERFFRVDPARSRQTGGTGLGLSIVKHVVADHGGDVTIWSKAGQGSTFTIRIPSAQAGEGLTAQDLAEPGAPGSEPTEQQEQTT